MVYLYWGYYMNVAEKIGYAPQEVEAYWRTYWEENKTFTAEVNSEKETYCIIIPPPNVTGSLHIGHALNLTLQDILCRHARQLGKNVLWIPGTDHAGIATQNVVERMLHKEGLSREQIGREKFIEKVWSWKEEYGNKILHQIRMLGASVDWTRERFTMDEGLSKAVRTAFVKLYNDGLIYKDIYSINWCIRCSTALADDEVEYEERSSHLWQIRYDIVDSDEYVVVATTRPETLLGDTALCVHPDDERYHHLIGKTVYLPCTQRTIPIISDSYVDREFGTGVLKITPAHDRNDWELGRKHNLATIQVIDADGYMNESAGEYKGLSREEARLAIVEALEKEGRLVHSEELTHSVGCCYRCKTVIEPYVSEQWFVATTKLAKQARDAVPEQTAIFPEQWVKTYYQWLDSMRDWCISRQIWWGHRIPAYTCSSCGTMVVSIEDITQCPKCSSTRIEQESDVLDTWFSSALWPFSTLGYPEKTRELAMFYPTSVLVTGFDILFFWVARMMMMGLYCMGTVPFRDVYIHALVRDAHGKKMSKSTGNVIDPLVMIEKYGTDALRFTLTSFAAMGRDIKLSEERIDGYRHFINKLWNVSRFVLLQCTEDTKPSLPKRVEGIHHCFILARLEEVRREVKQALEAYEFNEYAHSLYAFVWNDYCDWYVECVKLDLKTEKAQESIGILLTILEQVLILLHPVIPFCTAELYARLPHTKGKDISQVSYPEALSSTLCYDKSVFQYIQACITGIRSLRGELRIAPGERLDVQIYCATEEHKEYIQSYTTHICSLAKCSSIHIVETGKWSNEWATCVVEGDSLAIHLQGRIDIASEVQRLQKALDSCLQDIKKITAKLNNSDFRAKAPEEIIAKESEKKAKLEETIQRYTELIEQLK